MILEYTYAGILNFKFGFHMPLLEVVNTHSHG